MPYNGMDDNIWNVVLAHTPPVIRWMLAALGTAVVAVGAVFYKWAHANNARAHLRHTEAIREAERRHHDDIQDLRNRITSMDTKIDTHLTRTNELLAQISQHTERRSSSTNHRRQDDEDT